jgi:DNA-binding NarL/FixJ family response regulator
MHDPRVRSVSEAVSDISVAIADDHPVFLDGLEALIQAEAGMAVVATARNGEEAVRRVLALRPDVVIMDMRMPECDGVEATRRIIANEPGTRIIVLSGDRQPPVLEALKAGALGFMSKEFVAEALVEGIRDAAEGRPIVSRDYLTDLLAALRETPQTSPLTPRERAILELVALGRTNEQIGRTLTLSLSTVKAQLAALFEKLDASDRASALAVCFRRGWLT